ncbi:MAG: cation transporter [Gammaproteobacteria bacterium]|nr:cation transporter [Gammaproteobacteria bacterium]
MTARVTLSMVITLAGLWFLLSGKSAALILALGVASCVLVLFLSVRMKVTDEEGLPVYVNHVALVTYIAWLALEVIKANITVTKHVLAPRIAIDPVIFSVPARQRTVVGRVIYANSITLTPGTVSIDLDENSIEVHALTASGALELIEGDMGDRVVAVERHV